MKSKKEIGATYRKFRSYLDILEMKGQKSISKIYKRFETYNRYIKKSPIELHFYEKNMDYCSFNGLNELKFSDPARTSFLFHIWKKLFTTTQIE